MKAELLKTIKTHSVVELMDLYQVSTLLCLLYFGTHMWTLYMLHRPDKQTEAAKLYTRP